MLTYKGCRYTELSTSQKNPNRLWRCVFRENGRYTCKTYATTYKENGVEKAKFRGIHCHLPPDDFDNQKGTFRIHGKP